tara:strand:+ start:3110 stop:3340 length:231 start_codon:yes stop_codon:yes gene_type:complete
MMSLDHFSYLVVVSVVILAASMFGLFLVLLSQQKAFLKLERRVVFLLSWVDRQERYQLDRLSVELAKAADEGPTDE